MYWFREINILALLLYGGLTAAWAVGGWLLVVYAFRLLPSERLISGIAAGCILFITLGNLFAPLMPLPAAFSLAAGLILAAGLASGWAARKTRPLPFNDLKSWPQLVVFFSLIVIFAMIQRGLALFDDYLHLPLVSTMAAGDIPPHFYLNPEFRFTYHYALQVWAASMVRMAGLFPWSAWDLSKAVMIALTLMLGWVWVKRLTKSIFLASLGSALFTFGGGARWLLLLLPNSILSRLQTGIQLINSGADSGATLAQALAGPWVIEGTGVMPFPFAFHNGVFIPVLFMLGSTGALMYVTVLLLLLLVPRQRLTVPGIIILGLILANLALSAEHLFALLWVGLALSMLLSVWQNKRHHRPVPKDRIAQWTVILAFSALLSLIQGGFITEVARYFWLSLQGVAATQTNNYYGFGLRWPPAIYSAHLGILSVFDLRQLVVLLAEMGPVILLVPLAMVVTWKYLRRDLWLPASLGIAALLNLLFPLFISYGVDRSITRMPGTALWLWLVISFPALALVYRKVGQTMRWVLSLGYIVTMLGGVVIFAIQLTTIPVPQFSYFIDGLDTYMSARYWNKFPAGTEVFDPVSYRAVTLFGGAVRANSSIYEPLPEWLTLVRNPDPQKIAQAGYDMVYIADSWWLKLSDTQKAAFSQPCVQTIYEIAPENFYFRRLVDVSKCR